VGKLTRTVHKRGFPCKNGSRLYYFHGARFSNYSAWLSNPTAVKPSAQVVWPIVGQEILNGDVGGGFQGVQVTSGFFQIWRASGTGVL
jgi:photosystem I P700 chlorophyll a apoprotein A1